MQTKTAIILLAMSGGLGLLGCSSGGDSDSSSNNNNNQSQSSSEFPVGLALVPPTERSNGSARHTAALAGASQSKYEVETGKINAILAGTSSLSTQFDANMFFQGMGRAPCYGPKLAYQNHPDGADPAPMGMETYVSLPGGDLGLWQDSDASGTPCAAAQLNSQMMGISQRSQITLMTLAAMRAAADASGLTLPAAGGSLDLATALGGQGIANVTFNQASIALNAAGDTWNYTLAFSVTVGPAARNVSVSLVHTPGATEGEFTGVMVYQVNHPGSNGGDAIYHGSLFYRKAASGEVTLNAREGDYPANVTVNLVVDADLDASGNYKVLDPAQNGMNQPGWSGNFNMFGAVFDPTTLAGSYAYVWQAGAGDSHSRVLNVKIAQDATAGTSGDAFFGFGQPVGSTDGSILGMICNWAGPGANGHVPVDYAQRQQFALDSNTGNFAVTASSINFAPTNSCEYNGTGSFWYDRNLSVGTNGESTPNTGDAGDIVVVKASGAGAGELTMNMFAKGGAVTMQEAIAATGLQLPPM